MDLHGEHQHLIRFVRHGAGQDQKKAACNHENDDEFLKGSKHNRHQILNVSEVLQLIEITVLFPDIFLIRRMECWNTDYEKRKTADKKNVKLHFMMMLTKQLFPYFYPIDTPPTQENQCNNRRFEFCFL